MHLNLKPYPKNWLKIMRLSSYITRPNGCWKSETNVEILVLQRMIKNILSKFNIWCERKWPTFFALTLHNEGIIQRCIYVYKNIAAIFLTTLEHFLSLLYLLSYPKTGKMFSSSLKIQSMQLICQTFSDRWNWHGLRKIL